MQYIGVIDCNNFFVSCERLFRPDLHHTPVLVLSSNDGCVVARSKEIKDMGIPMGVPFFQIKDSLKKTDTKVFSSHLALYLDISKRVFAVIKDKLDIVEIYSIDEAFFILEAESVAEVKKILYELKSHVERCVGIPVSIGVAATKTQAKYANQLAKKADGVMVFTPADFEIQAKNILLRDIWGVGGQLARRYTIAELVTVADLLACPKPRLDSLFGIAGLRLQSELQGQVMYRVTNSHAVQKSIMSTRSFKDSTTSLAVLKDALAHHVRQASAELRSLSLSAFSIQVMIQTSRHGDYFLRGGRVQQVLDIPTNDTEVLLKIALELADKLYEANVPYKKAGILLGQFVPNTYVQTSFFTPANDQSNNQNLSAVIDELNARFGSEIVQLGRHTKAATWQSRRDQVSPAYTTKWTNLVVVSAK